MASTGKLGDEQVSVAADGISLLQPLEHCVPQRTGKALCQQASLVYCGTCACHCDGAHSIITAASSSSRKPASTAASAESLTAFT